MKKHLKEIIITALQLFMFYIFPLFAGPTDAMGMVFLIIVATFILSVTLSAITSHKLKYLYPFAVAVFFLPSVFIYYNFSALVHSVWYLVISAFGILIGAVINLIDRRIHRE